MEITIEYPMYGVWQDGECYCLDGVDDGGKPMGGVLIFSSQERASEFIRNHGLAATVRRFVNPYRLRRFLESLEEPTPEIMCDAVRDEQGKYSHAWREEVGVLLDEALPPMGFAWDYPLYLIDNERGVASIRGTTQDGQMVTLVAVFTDDDLAERYMRNSDATGSLATIDNEERFLAFVEDLAPTTDGIVVDLTSADAGSMGTMCIAKSKLIEHLSPDEEV